MKKIGLVIIDMQRAYFATEALQLQKDSLVKSINQLIHAANESKAKVFNIRTEHAKDTSTWTLNMMRDNEGFLFRGSDETKPVDGLDITNAIDIVKTRDSAFYNTILKDSLQKLNISTLILCGVSTHTCITQSAADAYAADIHVILAKDAVADDSPDFHDVSLSQLKKDYRQDVLSNQEIIGKYL